MVDIFNVAPQLKNITDKAISQAKVKGKWGAYEEAKVSAARYVGWHSRIKETRSKECYNLFIKILCDELEI